jgi:hypothetical protein
MKTGNKNIPKKTPVKQPKPPRKPKPSLQSNSRKGLSLFGR